MRTMVLFPILLLLSVCIMAQTTDTLPRPTANLRLAKIEKRINAGFVLLGSGLGTIPIFTGIAVYQLGVGLGNIYSDGNARSANFLVPAIMITGAAMTVAGTVLLASGLKAKKRHIKMSLASESPAPVVTMLLPRGAMAKHFFIKITFPF